MAKGVLSIDLDAAPVTVIPSATAQIHFTSTFTDVQCSPQVMQVADVWFQTTAPSH
jgi:hypothetical protein